jgi:prophage regulatory protein
MQDASEIGMEKIEKVAEAAKRVGLGRSTVYALAKTGQFPKIIELSRRASGVLSSEVDAWLLARIAERDKKAS